MVHVDETLMFRATSETGSVEIGVVAELRSGQSEKRGGAWGRGYTNHVMSHILNLLV